MARKVATEGIKRLTVELPESEYAALERYCLARQVTKRQVIRSLIRQLGKGEETRLIASVLESQEVERDG